jgi:hypothetical protein
MPKDVELATGREEANTTARRACSDEQPAACEVPGVG